MSYLTRGPNPNTSKTHKTNQKEDKKVATLTALYFFKNEVETLLLLHVLDELDDVGVVLAVVERVDLLEDAAARVAGVLVDDLDGHLDVGVDVARRLDGGAGALAQDLSSQPVQVREAAGRRRLGQLLAVPLALHLRLAPRLVEAEVPLAHAVAVVCGRRERGTRPVSGGSARLAGSDRSLLGQ